MKGADKDWAGVRIFASFATKLSMSYKSCPSMSVKSLLKIFIIITQRLLNYYPHKTFLSEFSTRSHLISPEEQVLSLLSEKKSYIIDKGSFFALATRKLRLHFALSHSKHLLSTTVCASCWCRHSTNINSLNPHHDSTK